MRIAFLIPLLFVVACTSQQLSTTETTSAPPAETPLAKPVNEETGILTYDWRGELEGGIPVQLQYQVEGDIVTGNIWYLKNKNKTPIPLIGSVKNNEFELLEFAKEGNITGIIGGKREGKTLVGSWYSPAMQKERKMQLTQTDTTFPTHTTAALPADIGGSYSYSYGEDGPQGTLTLKPLAGGKALLEILTVTHEPARNIADIEADTVTLEGDQVIYRFPDSPECSFRVRFYKNFAVVNYLTNDGCASQFGHNATVEGTFFKVGN